MNLYNAISEDCSVVATQRSRIAFRFVSSNGLTPREIGGQALIPRTWRRRADTQ
jgi:hypothetical protein